MAEHLLVTTEGSRPQAFGPTEWGLLFAAAMIWGTSYLWIDLALISLAPSVVTVARLGLGWMAISLVPRARRRVDPADRRRIIALGLGWLALPMVAIPIAQDLGVDSSMVGMLNGASPLITALSASVLLRHLPGRRQMVGLAVGLLGLTAIVAPEIIGLDPNALGVVLVLVGISTSALLSITLVPLQQHYGALPVLRAALGVALIVTLPYGLAGTQTSTWGLVSLIALVPLGVASTGLAFVAKTTLTGRAGAARGSVVSYLVPVVATILGVWLLHEHVPVGAWLGMPTVLVGAWLVSGRDHSVAIPLIDG